MSALPGSNDNSFSAQHEVVKTNPYAAFTHEDLLRCNTGRDIDPEKYRDSCSRQSKLINQTNNIADKLESQGIPARTGDGDVTAIGDVTGVCDTVEQFRSESMTEWRSFMA